MADSKYFTVLIDTPDIIETHQVKALSAKHAAEIVEGYWRRMGWIGHRDRLVKVYDRPESTPWFEGAAERLARALGA